MGRDIGIGCYRSRVGVRVREARRCGMPRCAVNAWNA